MLTEEWTHKMSSEGKSQSFFESHKNIQNGLKENIIRVKIRVNMFL